MTGIASPVSCPHCSVTSVPLQGCPWCCLKLDFVFTCGRIYTRSGTFSGWTVVLSTRVALIYNCILVEVRKRGKIWATDGEGWVILEALAMSTCGDGWLLSEATNGVRVGKVQKDCRSPFVSSSSCTFLSHDWWSMVVAISRKTWI